MSDASPLPYTQDERTWALLAHLTILLSLISGGLLGIAAAFIIWLIKKPESAYVGQQALQSLLYQIAAVIVNWVMWIAIAIGSALIVGICCIPIGALVSLATLVWPLYAAYACSLGRDFKYPVIAELAGIR